MLDLYLLYSFVRRLVKPFKEWDAYSIGAIDEDGNILKSRKSLSYNDKKKFTLMDLLIINIKKLLMKFPAGKTRIATFAAALYLLKEGDGFTEDNLEKELENINIDYILENYSEQGKLLMENESLLKQNFLKEDAPTNNIGDGKVADKGGEIMNIVKRVVKNKKKKLSKDYKEKDMSNPDDIQEMSLARPTEYHDLKRKLQDKYKKVDNREGGWVHSVSDAMEAFGFSKVGSGKYGSVFINPKYPYAIKVFMKDAAYLRWLSFCIKNQNNPYIPKVKGRVVKITDVFYAIRLEKLSDLTTYSPVDEIESGYESWTTFGDSDKRFLNNKPLIEIFKEFKKNHNLLDIHQGNIMKRSDGQPVIIDPYYNYYSPSEGRFTIDLNDFNKSGLF